eukprot:2135134-Pyramimonas_sp.AAC.1
MPASFSALSLSFCLIRDSGSKTCSSCSPVCVPIVVDECVDEWVPASTASIARVGRGEGQSSMMTRL